MTAIDPHAAAPAAPAPRKLSLPVSPHKPRPYTGPSKAETIALRQEYVNPAIFYIYKEPMMIVEGKMEYLWDETGKQYLDGFGGIVTISAGHCHPKITEKVRAQPETLTHTTTVYFH